MSPVARRVAPFFALIWLGSAVQADEFPKIFDSQAVGKGDPSPQQAVEKISLPPGFQVSLFAAEPHVRQPIAMATDHRGRLWVVENYTYANSQRKFAKTLRDRILILEDTDGDGTFDKRRVFWDQGKLVTSVEIGHGGVWVLAAPQLLFIPDRNRDDIPDGPPEVVLDGWNAEQVRHNIVNGLRWGPDGWLYGRHGILATSNVGTPETAPEHRKKINCGIWRYHPTRKTFEVVCRGTTNPWGMDWDDHGQFFFINTVIGHLWHVVPGAQYKRMYGEHFNSNLYELIDQSADHFHWDISAEAWNDLKRKGMTASTDDAGGGHAHSGMMIYLGDHWPSRYRNSVFTLNLHGRRINHDRLRRRGAGYVGQHAPDFMRTKDPWFRGIELCYGPDGGVYVADWSDIGECHENDGVHRTSGRIYKIVYRGDGPQKISSALGIKDLTQVDPLALVRLQLERNDWYVRHARRILHEQHVAGHDLTAAQAELRAMYEKHPDVTRRLRALWCLHVTGALDTTWLVKQMSDESEHVRVWAIQLLMESGTLADETRRGLEQVADTEQSGLVLSFLASALQRLPHEHRFRLAKRIAAKSSFADDPVLPLMVWYGIEPAVLDHPSAAIDVAKTARMGKVRRYVTRRLTSQIERLPRAVADLVALLEAVDNDQFQADILAGMKEALEGWQKAPAPQGWGAIATRLSRSQHSEVAEMVRGLSLVFGDGRAMAELREIARSNKAALPARRAAIQSLVATRAAGMPELLQHLMKHRDLAADAIRGLAVYNQANTDEKLIENMRTFRQSARDQAVAVLVSRPTYAESLLIAIEQGKIDRKLVSAFQLRQLQTFRNKKIDQRISTLWPELKQLTAEKRSKIAQYRKSLSSSVLAKADLPQGRALFQRSCAKCHRLFGQGGQVGPDLTGAQRNNLEYLLENIVDPSATVSKNFHMSVIVLESGRILNGIVSPRSPQTVTVQTPTERLIVAHDEIEVERPSKLSIMPERMLDVLQPSEVRDLIGYLMSPSQIPLPRAANNLGRSAGDGAK